MNDIKILKNKKEVGRIKVQDCKLKLENSASGELAALIQKAETEGITRLRDIHQNNIITTIEENVTPSDPHFYLALLGWLRRNGYEVIPATPDIDKRLIALIKRLPDEVKEKTELLKEVPDLTYLEKTFLLEELEESQNDKAA